MASGIEWYEVELNNSTWILPERYQNLTALGQGAYGLVCSADDTLRNEKVAIKKLAQPFMTKIHSKRTYREIKLLKHNQHDNIIQLLDIFTRATSAQDLDEIYLVTNLMSTDLNNVLKTQHLTEDQIRFFAYQILRGLKYLHTSNIIHRVYQIF